MAASLAAMSSGPGQSAGGAFGNLQSSSEIRKQQRKNFLYHEIIKNANENMSELHQNRIREGRPSKLCKYDFFDCVQAAKGRNSANKKKSNKNNDSVEYIINVSGHSYRVNSRNLSKSNLFNRWFWGVWIY